MRQGILTTLLDAIAILTADFEAATEVDVDTDVITSSSHGFKDGDRVQITTDGSLPTGISASTTYIITAATDDTFKLKTTAGVIVDITATGSGTHTATMSSVSKAFNAKDFEDVVIALDTADSADLTIKFLGSKQDQAPDFEAAQSASNQYAYIESVDLRQTSAVIVGDTGIALSGTDTHRHIEINTNQMSWIAIEITSYVAGTVTAKAQGSSRGE